MALYDSVDYAVKARCQSTWSHDGGTHSLRIVLQQSPRTCFQKRRDWQLGFFELAQEFHICDHRFTCAGLAKETQDIRSHRIRNRWPLHCSDGRVKYTVLANMALQDQAFACDS